MLCIKFYLYYVIFSFWLNIWHSEQTRVLNIIHAVYFYLAVNYFAMIPIDNGTLESYIPSYSPLWGNRFVRAIVSYFNEVLLFNRININSIPLIVYSRNYIDHFSPSNLLKATLQPRSRDFLRFRRLCNRPRALKAPYVHAVTTSPPVQTPYLAAFLAGICQSAVPM